MSAPVVLAPHSPVFAKCAAEEAERWRRVCGTAMTAFHHIGSTAVPGLLAKPILDVMPVFVSLEKLDALRSRICALGVTWLGEHGLPGRRFCKCSDATPVQHIHCYAAGHHDVLRHIAFRDYLRAHPAIAAAYARTKETCAKQHPDDRHAYGDCKSGWITATENAALIWYQKEST